MMNERMRVEKSIHRKDIECTAAKKNEFPSNGGNWTTASIFPSGACHRVDRITLGDVQPVIGQPMCV